MPLIATCTEHRRQGMCRRLIGVIEEVLSFFQFILSFFFFLLAATVGSSELQ